LETAQQRWNYSGITATKASQRSLQNAEKKLIKGICIAT